MKTKYEERINKTRIAIRDADAILIGAGAGLSASAGITYSGERFERNFPDFIEKYQLTDMYSSGFYPFETEEERWAYWSRHIKLNRWNGKAGTVYSDLQELIKDKNHFVMTTNADGQFLKTDISRDNIFIIQGDYGKLQCATKCHEKLYENRDIIEEMVTIQKDCLIPTSLVPICPVCGGHMDPNLRKDNYFVEDDLWRNSFQKYNDFISYVKDSKIVFLELGVGYNTPSIIKYPFEQMTKKFKNATLIRMNREYPEYSEANKDKTITFVEDISRVVQHLL